MTIKQAIKIIIEQKNLCQEDAYQICSLIMSGNATPAQISALLIGLALKGETIPEITGFVQAMREKAARVKCQDENVIDTCGTGGDGTRTFNISTVAALVAAGAGCAVAKHGNRSVSSNCGSADLLTHLGVNIDIEPERMAQCIDMINMGFLFAPILHGAMKYAIKPRQEIGIRTIFNILGPLTNPANAQRQLIGVFSAQLTQPIAEVLRNLGTRHALVVHGEDGLDEITITGKTMISELNNGKIINYTIQPEDFGMMRGCLDHVICDSIQDNADKAMAVLNKADGAKRDIVLLNAGAAIYIAGRAESIAQGIELAKESIDSGRAISTLKQLITMTK